MKRWKTSGTGLKHDFMTFRTAEAAAEPEENHMWSEFFR